MPSSSLNSSSNDISVLMKDTIYNAGKTPAPETVRLRSYRFLNADNSIRGDLRNALFPDGSVSTIMWARNYDDDTIVNAYFGVTAYPDGSNGLFISPGISKNLMELSFPSSSQENLTLPTSLGTLSSPYTGYVVFIHRISTAGDIINLYDSTSGLTTRSVSSQDNQLLAVTLPVVKGDTIGVEYTNSSSYTDKNKFYIVKAIGNTLSI